MEGSTRPWGFDRPDILLRSPRKSRAAFSTAGQLLRATSSGFSARDAGCGCGRIAHLASCPCRQMLSKRTRAAALAKGTEQQGPPGRGVGGGGAAAAGGGLQGAARALRWQRRGSVQRRGRRGEAMRGRWAAAFELHLHYSKSGSSYKMHK